GTGTEPSPRSGTRAHAGDDAPCDGQPRRRRDRCHHGHEDHAMTTMTADVRASGELVVEGEIDMSNSADFAAAIDDALGDGSQPLPVDLTGVEYLDSAGIHVLLIRAARIVVVTSPLLLPVLTICGLTQATSVRSIEA